MKKPTKTAPAKSPPAAASPPPTPDPAASGFPVVGIGASAGGLTAISAFFSGMPAAQDPGMAFVIVQHLAPDHKSILTELIQRCTRMQVFEVEDGMAVQPNCVYIIPPNYDMAFGDGTLQLFAPAAPRGLRLPVDFLFRSLAASLHAQAIGIILSGTGSDGTLGLRAIKGEGGMAMVQKAETAEYDGMPRSALATGLADYVLPPAEMPPQLMAFAARALVPFQAKTVPVSIKEDERKKILILLRAQTGHDFSQYKASTINRRIARRMAVHQIDGIEEYVRYLRQAPQEVESLFRDLLIGVTGFFRDPKAFEVLAEVAIPKLFAGRPPGSPIRVWVPGCSTGEEAYSIAILLQEEQDRLKHNHPIQIFAGDIDDEALATGRVGVYPISIAADISKERLARFFTVEPGNGFVRVRKSIRDLLLFSKQDVTRDPPFSRLDLISCRNLLIYFNADVQKRLFPLFHYALNPDGFLFLGTSETTGNSGELFALQNPAAKLYQRREAPRVALADFIVPIPVKDRVLTQPGKMAQAAGASQAFPVKALLRELTEQALLKQVISAGALVNGSGDILYLHGSPKLYLEPVPGEARLNILKMAREGLGNALTLALHKAASQKETVRQPGLRVKSNSHFTTVNLTIRPIAESPATSPDGRLYLVILEESPAAAKTEAKTAAPDTNVDERIAALQQELRDKDEYLQTSKEELESSNEELQSSNEEMQSLNEELQSTNEELQTSQEELQSVNEELLTVNTELQSKVADLSQAKNDRDNLLAGTSIATVFVDLQLRILSFTPAAAKIISLIPTDIGRPVGHFVAALGTYSTLVADTQSVLDTLAQKDVEVQTAAGLVYMLRIHPYRTLENVIEGAVITLVDITELRKASVDIVELRRVQGNLIRATELLERTGAIAQIGGWELDLRTQELTWSAEVYRIHEVDPRIAPTIAQAQGYHDPETRAKLQGLVQAAIEHGTPWDYEAPMTTAKQRSIWVRGIGTAVLEDGKTVKLRGTFQDITKRKQVEAALRESEARFRLVQELSPDGFTILRPVCNAQGRVVDFTWVYENATIARLNGTDPEAVVGRRLLELFPGHRDSQFLRAYQQVAESGEQSIFESAYEDESMPKSSWFRIVVVPLGGDIAILTEDISERKQAEDALRTMSLQLTRAEDAERRRIARELHDSTGQKLAALSTTVGLLQDATGVPAGKTDAMFTDCLTLIEQCAQEIRTFSYLLHPPLLDELGLVAAIRDYADGFSKRSKVQVTLDAPPDLARLPDEVELTLFRVVQESLGNIHRHSGASLARIRLACDAEQVTLEVSDEGRGIPPEMLRTIEAGLSAAGVGIPGMRERLRLLGGRLVIESGGQGTTVRASMPRPQELK